MSETPLIEPELVPAATAAGLATPGAILTRMRLVDADVRAFNEEVRANRARLTTAFERGWAHWRDTWFRFYREHEGLVARAWPGTLGEVEAFARRLPEWRARAEAAGMRLESPRPAQPAPPPRLPNLPSLPGFPDLSPLRELAQALPRAAQALPTPAELLQPARDLLEQSPLSSRYWENLKPVAIAGACAVGGLGLVWVLWNLRMAMVGAGARANASAEVLRDPEVQKLIPLIASRGLVR